MKGKLSKFRTHLVQFDVASNHISIFFCCFHVSGQMCTMTLRTNCIFFIFIFKNLMGISLLCLCPYFRLALWLNSCYLLIPFVITCFYLTCKVRMMFFSFRILTHFLLSDRAEIFQTYLDNTM